MIEFDLPEDSHVLIIMYNMMGQKVVTLVSKDYSAGYHKIIWQGKDDLDQLVSSGIYLCRMTAGEFSALRKLILIR